MTQQGIDYAWHGPLNPDQWVRDGITFACRYMSFDDAKDLHLAEAKQLSAAGVSLVLVWENQSDDVLGGEAKGKNYAAIAADRLAGLGAPATARIYVAIDMAATGEQAIAYMGGWASIRQPSQLGVYGSRAVCAAVQAQWPAILCWQTLAWSGHIWLPSVAIEQYGSSYSGGGLVRADRDRALVDDFGQWTIPYSKPEPPAQPPFIPDHSRPVLREGAKGTEVRTMQLLLIHKGFSCGDHGPDGDWGPDTQKAFMDFQQHIKTTIWPDMAVDGICGPKSWGALEQ